MKRKRMFGVLLMVLILSASSVFVYAKTDEATRSFKLKGHDVSGSAKVAISTGKLSVNTAKSSGSIKGSEVHEIINGVDYAKVTLSTCYGNYNYKLHYTKLAGSAKKTGYCMWTATMKVYQVVDGDETRLVAWTVSCA